MPGPRITVSRALELCCGFARERTFGKRHNQFRRRENPRRKAVRNFIALVGDKNLLRLSRDDMIDFRQRWLDQIRPGGVTARSARKDLIHLGEALTTVTPKKRLGPAVPRGALSIRRDEARTRPPFSVDVDWITTGPVAPGALDGLHDQARGLLLGMVNTGYRPSAGAALTAADPAGLRLAAYRSRARGAAAELPPCAARDPAGGCVARGLPGLLRGLPGLPRQRDTERHREHVSAREGSDGDARER